MNETNDVADATQPTREEMIAFLRGHFRYYTMNSWNRSTSYARKIKIRNLGFTREQQSRAYDLIYIEDTFLEINERIRSLVKRTAIDIKPVSMVEAAATSY